MHLTPISRRTPNALGRLLQCLRGTALKGAAMCATVLALTQAAPALASIDTLHLTPPAAAGGTETLAIYTTPGSAPVVIYVPIPAGSTIEDKQKAMVEALTDKGFNALAHPGDKIKVENIHDVRWISGTGEAGDGLGASARASGEFGLLLADGSRGPTGHDEQGNPSFFQAGFFGPGLNAHAQLTAANLPQGFAIDDVLSMLYQDLLGDLPDELKGGLQLDLHNDLISFNPTGLPLPHGPFEWTVLGGTTDQGLDGAIRLTSLPEPGSLVLLLLAVGLAQQVRGRQKSGAC